MTVHVLAVSALFTTTDLEDAINAAVSVACTCGEVLDVFHGPVTLAEIVGLHQEHVDGAAIVDGCEQLLAGID